jgi:ActR/RegA family two-component response regulator
MKDIRLLLVDDEDDFRQTLANRLTKKGIPPEQAESGETALSILEIKEDLDQDERIPFLDNLSKHKGSTQ